MTLVRSVIYANKHEDKNATFCSELVAASLRSMGLSNPQQYDPRQHI